MLGRVAALCHGSYTFVRGSQNPNKKHSMVDPERPYCCSLGVSAVQDLLDSSGTFIAVAKVGTEQ